MQDARAAIDPEAIRAGEAAALMALVQVRGDSVIAYCLELAGPEGAPRAAAESMARFRSAIHVLGAENRVETDVLLLAATRHSAAQAADLDMLWESARIQDRDPNCGKIPTMLAARAMAQLGAKDLERVARHLWRCEGCRLVEAAFARAEQAYREPTVDPERHEAAMMVAALESAAPVSALPQRAPEAEAEPEAEPEPAPDILGEIEPAGFLDDAEMDPRNEPTVVFDVLQPDSELYPDAALLRHEPFPQDDDYVPGRSSTLVFSILAMVAVVLVLAVAYAFDGLPGQDDAGGGAKSTPVTAPADPAPTSPATR